jgi:heptosyltransferase-2
MDAPKMENGGDRVLNSQKVLIRLPNWIGDAILSIPALTAVRSLFKNSEITFIGKGPILELLQENRLSDHSIVLNGSHRGIFQKWSLVRKLRKEKFDLAILFQNAFEAALLSFLSFIPNRYGYNTDGRGFLLTHRIPKPSKKEKIHQLEYYLHLVASLEGIDLKQSKPAIQVTQDKKREARKRLEREGIAPGEMIIGLNPGAAYGNAKRWPPERFAQLGDRLSRAHKVKIMIFGGASEKNLMDHIESLMVEKPLNVAGKTTVRELIALISECALFITNDSGPMHIASALNVPVISIFGPTDSEATSPAGNHSIIVRKGVECSPCLLRECPIDHRCMTGVSVEDVFIEAQDQLFLQNDSGSPAIFLDRDGTINQDTHYVSSEEEFLIFTETPEAIALFNQMEFPVFIISNQSGVERGYFSSGLPELLHEKLEGHLKKFQAKVSGFYYCPHRPETGCGCRKPKTGLLRKVMEKYPVNLKKSYVIGDQISDLELAHRVGAKGVLVLTGKGKETLLKLKDRPGIAPAYVAAHILDAARWIKQENEENNR